MANVADQEHKVNELEMSKVGGSGPVLGEVAGVSAKGGSLSGGLP